MTYTPEEARARAAELRVVAEWMRQLPSLTAADVEARAKAILDRDAGGVE